MIVYREDLVEVRQGHVGAELEAMPQGKIQLCLTSPPYYTLRSYQVEPQVWGGAPGCGHVWGVKGQRIERRRTDTGLAHTGTGSPETRLPGLAEAGYLSTSQGTFCQLCHAWKGSLGLEPTPWCHASLLGEPCTDHCYLGHLLEVFDGVKRILRDDGTLVVNLSDSFSSQPINGLAPKNLLNLPARFSIAMQGKGWILRNSFQWIKRNCMPGSQTDRPTVSHESLFIFVKQGSYYWDQEAVRQGHQQATKDDRRFTSQGQRYQTDKSVHHAYHELGDARQRGNGNMIEWRLNEAGRTIRTGDWWYGSLDEVIADTEAWMAHAKDVRKHGGLLLSPEGEPLGLNVNPQPTKMAHFAAFSPRLVEPFIKACTSEYGACGACGTAWRRVVSRTQITPVDYEGKWGEADPQTNGRRMLANVRARRQSGQSHDQPFPSPTILAWMPQCACGGYRIDLMPPYGPQTIPEWWQARQSKAEYDWPPVVPCTVLDPFAGTGRTAEVARHFGRQSVMIDLSAQYCDFIRDTLHADLPLFEEDDAPVTQMIQAALDL